MEEKKKIFVDYPFKGLCCRIKFTDEEHVSGLVI